MAADEWVSEYLQSRERSERDETTELDSAELALIRAPGFFELIIRKVASDVRAFNSYMGNGRINFQLLDRALEEEYAKWTGFFVAQRQRYPFTSLVVKLRDNFLDYETCVIKDQNHKDTVRGSFRIAADIRGRIYAVRDCEPYSDVSEISEFLLRPVFDSVDFTTRGW